MGAQEGIWGPLGPTVGLRGTQVHGLQAVCCWGPWGLPRSHLQSTYPLALKNESVKGQGLCGHAQGGRWLAEAFELKEPREEKSEGEMKEYLL